MTAKALDILTNEQKKNLTSKIWRLNNLYMIVPKSGPKKIMKLNHSQRKILTKFKHPRKIILKSRQQGISTLYLAYNLDSCITKSNYSAGVQSYGKDEGEKLAERAKIMWDDMPKAFKDSLGVTLVRSNTTLMEFSNGSTLRIGNFRGDTLQSLHVSELGKIAVKFPEKAKELKTGAFEAVGQGNRLTIESTAEGKHGLYYDTWLKAYNKSRLKTQLTPFDFEAIFLSWVVDPDCNISVPVIISAELESYFREIEQKLDTKLEQTQKWWYATKLDGLGEDMKREYPSYPEEAFEQSTEGTIYKVEYNNLFKEKRIQSNIAIKNYPCTVSYDLGMNDSTDLIFTQVYKGRPRIVYHYQNSGQNIEFYVDIMHKIRDQLKLGAITTILPHDAQVREMQTGRTRLQEFRRLGVNAVVQPKQSIADGIQAVRQFLAVCTIDADNCEELVEAIQVYRWKFDKRLQVYLQTPEHDEASNPCDSLRYTALGIPYNKTIPTHNIDKPFDYERNISRTYDYRDHDGFAV